MLDVRTRQRIDTARDILVGKVPDPKSQVEQITLALMYKFMGDIDAQSEEYGGKATFFAGDFARYSWRKIVGRGIGAYDALNLYSEGMTRMGENPGLPALFRSMFNNAYLPFRDPETLKGFLQVIDEFEYDNSERLGDAFEYLLSIMGSQGDAGQFRTPRHIIDFIVEIVDPKKDDTILDPACGTAGFLISAYKHIAKTSTDAETPLTSAERSRLANNVRGYDISPDMVRLSLVNLYLHGFPDPDIYEYDTLTSEERWIEYANVILANPPFMSPKGGIRPHNRFSVTSKRSEVLFVDYIAEHLTPDGRAGVIVPEGIIFQGQNAYKQLRKMLVDEYLVAVVSLPPGVFNPYSGVKTSILILDKSLAKRSDTIGFFKVENDGFDLGAQRRPVDRNDLPRVKAEVAEYLRRVREEDGVGENAPEHGLVVEKERIGADGEFNLSGERYRIGQVATSMFDMVPFEEVCTLEYGKSLRKQDRVEGPFPVMGSNGISGYHKEYLIDGPAIIIGRKGSAGEVTYVESNCFPIDTTYYVKLVDKRIVDIQFLYRLLKNLDLPDLRGGAGIPGINRNDVYAKHKLPLPPMEIQREIVSEIVGCQRVIDGARAVVENWQPRIAVDPGWPTLSIGEICRLINGRAFKPRDWEPAENGGLPIVRIQNLNNPDGQFNYFSGEVKEKFLIDGGQLLFSWSGSRDTSFGAHIWSGGPAILNQHIFRVEHDEDKAVDHYLLHVLNMAVSEVIQNLHGGVGLVHITKGNLERIRIPIPPITIQHEIVEEIESEKRLVEGNRRLIERMEGKIRSTVERVWSQG